MFGILAREFGAQHCELSVAEHLVLGALGSAVGGFAGIEHSDLLRGARALATTLTGQSSRRR